MQNYNGWSEYSEVSYIYAFAIPEKPRAPTFHSGTDSSVTLEFTPSLNDHGVRISHYELWIDGGDDTRSSFRQLTSYSQFTQLHTLEQSADGLGLTGTLYRVKFAAVNELALRSDFSNEFIFRLGPLPSQPAPVNKVDAFSSGGMIALEWSAVTTDSLDILGYKLYANSGRNEPLRLVYDGSTDPQTTTFVLN